MLCVCAVVALLVSGFDVTRVSACVPAPAVPQLVIPRAPPRLPIVLPVVAMRVALLVLAVVTM